MSRMRREDILINFIISAIVTIVAPFVVNKLLPSVDLITIILITLLIIFLFWFGSYVKEIEYISKENLKEIKVNKKEINDLKKDLNILERLTRLEEWRNNMKKRGQINIVDLIRIIAIILIIYLFLKVLNIFP